MAITVNMPQLGETVTEGTILSWAKKAGDSISEDEVLLEVSTDKVDTEVPSPAAGVIREILVPAGETVSVGTPLVVIAELGEAEAETPSQEPAPHAQVAAETPTDDSTAAVEDERPDTASHAEPAEPAQTGPAAPASSDEPRRTVLSPVVRKLAAEYDLDLDDVAGTGSGGRITRKDVMAFIEAGGAAREDAPAARVTLEPAPEPSLEPPPARPSSPTAAMAAGAVGEGPSHGDEATVVELSRLRGTIAKNMSEAKRAAAHVWTSVEVDFENVERVRAAHRGAFKEHEGFSLTYMPFIARATIDALHAFPVVNSSLSVEDNTATYYSSIHLGIAVDLDEGGLIVTTVRDADQMRMTGLARAIRRLADKTKSGNIELDDITRSTFTITNPGPFGSFMSAPIINVPNVAILSTDTVVKRPTVVTLPEGGDGIAIHRIGYLSLSWDHRAFDGSTAVFFLNRIKENLETWDWEQELS